MTVQIISLRFFFLKEKKIYILFIFLFYFVSCNSSDHTPRTPRFGHRINEASILLSWLLVWDTTSSHPALSLQQQKWGQVQQLWLDHQRWDFLAVSVSGNWTCLGGLLAAVTEQHGAPCIHTAKQSSLITWCLRPRLIFKPQPEILGSLSCSGPEL